MYPNSGDWYDGMLVILSLRYVVNARMFVEVGCGRSVGSVLIVPSDLTCSLDRITSIPSYQSPELGYMGMVEEKTVYALTGADPWVDFNNPGAYRDRTD